jgi:hypothetical protein
MATNGEYGPVHESRRHGRLTLEPSPTRPYYDAAIASSPVYQLSRPIAHL